MGEFLIDLCIGCSNCFCPLDLLLCLVLTSSRCDQSFCLSCAIVWIGFLTFVFRYFIFASRAVIFCFLVLVACVNPTTSLPNFFYFCSHSTHK
ncbi:hypothetical protein EDB19DRAFT_886718 [Suillus lakei]|nr:hypothetical protein EDB19DRAFT_886718 [Suillus lakei]